MSSGRRRLPLVDLAKKNATSRNKILAVVVEREDGELHNVRYPAAPSLCQC